MRSFIRPGTGFLNKMSFGLYVAVDVIQYPFSFFLSFIYVFIIFPLIPPVVLVTSDNKRADDDGDI